MLSGQMLKAGIISAASHLNAHRNEVDTLNVFPVPDGDTGTNMSMTVTAAAREINLLSDDTAFDVAAERVASAMLRGARGNSGVILSLIFRGISKTVHGHQKIDGEILARALAKGSEAAYSAVMKPTEGTILTVVRFAAQKAADAVRGTAVDAVSVWDAALNGAKDALAQTPSMLPVLKQAGVVDAGGQGLVYIMEGLQRGFRGAFADDMPQILESVPPQRSAVAMSDSEIEFAYCTEFLVERTQDAEKTDAGELRTALGELGDCVVVVDDDDVIKVHVHNNQPGTVLCLGQAYGQFVQVKVENMRKQHQEASWVDQQGAETEQAPPPQKTKKCGFVSVATGDGLMQLFRELGVDQIVSGGQSMNPSTEDILNAINQTGAEHVFVLPNNKNIIMAAEQAAPLTDAQVRVLRTKSIVQGIGAMLAFDETVSVEANHVQMQRAGDAVQTGLVTYAARSSIAEGMNIRKGEIIGLENGNLTVKDDDPVKAAYRVARHLVRKFDASMITIYVGKDVSEEQTAQLLAMLDDRYKGGVETTAIDGGQPLYYYMIAVE
ncbi:MAG: DAK2 domain-containing protein [Oscillospiraceae bacterium]|jgi:DAK2 domain fusion protein YloV|nr:DAK2 domain-containing protein [Oscillospiraceae bacterium]